MTFKDHFSGQAGDYARYRPSYPEDLFDWLAGLAPTRVLAWDCATGNGQAAVGLARHFRRVEATDASAAQIAGAEPAPGVHYRVAPAEQSGLAEGSAGVVTVAQALHWFDFGRFHDEAARVLADGGVLAAWTYGLCRVSDAVDALVVELYRDHLGDYWPPERAHIEAGYATIPFPWPRLAAPEFSMRVEWHAGQMLGYLSTWSAVVRCREQTGEDPLRTIAARLEVAWGEDARVVVWPLTILAGRRPARDPSGVGP